MSQTPTCTIRTRLAGGSLADRGVRIGQQSLVHLDEITAPDGDGHRITQTLPLLREENRNTPAKQPVELFMASGRHAEQNHLDDAIRVLLGVREGQGASP